MLCDITYTWNLKKKKKKKSANERICKTEVESQMWKTNLKLKGMGGRDKLGD